MLKKDDKVVMHTCGEAEHYNGKVWTCKNDEYVDFEGQGIYERNLVFLEGFSGSFLTKYLQKVNLDPIEQELDRLWTERYAAYGISKDREYVLLSVKWSKNGYLVFWGSQTKDKEKRSYSGYTMDVDKCEKYTYKEAVNEDHPEWKGQKFWELKKECWDGTWAVKIKDLHHFGDKKSIIYM